MMIDMDEALRYLGASGANDALRSRVRRTAEELEARLAPRFIFREFPLALEAGGVSLPGAGLTLTGSLARRMLKTCHHAALLVCTLGAEFEAMQRACQARDMAKAVILDACGSAYVESGCAEAEKKLASLHPGAYFTDRFSPGYGDLPLALQEGLLRATDAARRLGVQMGESCLLIPAKTVTAVIGIADEPQRARIRGCAYCALRENCALREGGKRCDG
ncbi:MAG: methionine synthase [Clostridia bacterium]|nr:methionine synthase [Clostridia bacterium]